MIVGLLLAAGRGSRFGSDKLLAPLGTRAVLRWSAEALVNAVDRTIVVVPADAHALRLALDGVQVTFVEHAGRDDGMASSIRAGVAALPPGTRAVVLALGDQPLVDRAVAARLCDRWRTTGAPVVVPHYSNGVGHPVLFDASCFAALAALEGDRGARPVVQAMGSAVARVEVEGLMPEDVDSPAALAELSARLGR